MISDPHGDPFGAPVSRSLAPEIAYFNAHVDTLRGEATAQNKRAVLIFDREVVGYYDSVVNAANVGYERFGSSLFLARDVEPEAHQPAIASIFSAR